ncbi:hypothetical protein [Falsiruegeria mediterranea]|nr:hypothetical protein [Falsiruegeria mediterranea]
MGEKLALSHWFAIEVDGIAIAKDITNKERAVSFLVIGCSRMARS